MSDRPTAYDALVAGNPITGDTPPQGVWTADVALLEIDRRSTGMQTPTPTRLSPPGDGPAKPPRRRYGGVLIAAAAFTMVLVIGIATLMLTGGDPGPAEPAGPTPTTIAPQDTAPSTTTIAPDPAADLSGLAGGFVEALYSGDLAGLEAMAAPATDLDFVTDYLGWLTATNAFRTAETCTVRSVESGQVRCEVTSRHDVSGTVEMFETWDLTFGPGGFVEARRTSGTPSAAEQAFFAAFALEHPNAFEPDGPCAEFLGNASERGEDGPAACAEIMVDVANAGPSVVAAREFFDLLYSGNIDELTATMSPSADPTFIVDYEGWLTASNGSRIRQSCSETVVHGPDAARCRVTKTDDITRPAGEMTSELWVIHFDESGWALVDYALENSEYRDQFFQSFVEAFPTAIDDEGICGGLYLGSASSRGPSGPAACAELMIGYVEVFTEANPRG